MADPRFIADAALPAVRLEDFTVVYHAASGATHLLASPVPEILAAIAPDRGAATVAAIVDRLRVDYELEGEDGGAVVAARLAELEAAGLVRRA